MEHLFPFYATALVMLLCGMKAVGIFLFIVWELLPNEPKEG